MTVKIILALDTADINQALEVASKVKDKVFTIKLGLEFFNSNGKNGIQKFNDMGINNLMLDLKLNDIPETVSKAILALESIKFEYLTVMAFGGSEMIKRAKQASMKLDPNIKILAVTVLTSNTQNELNKMGINATVEDTVVELAKNSVDADGFVCSALEAKVLKAKLPKNKLVFCPGIRMPTDSKNDQERISTPSLALNNGADAIIMGRSLTKGNILENINRLYKSLKI